MTDNDKAQNVLDERIAKVNGAVLKLSALAFEALNEGNRPSRQDTIDYINSVGVLVGSIVVSLSEIADSVGKIARQSEADFKSAVDAAAEQKADVKATEANKRSFIGQRRKD